MSSRFLLLVTSIASTLPGVLTGQAAESKAWVSLGAGVTVGRDFLTDVSAWYSPGLLAIGLRASGASEIVFAEHDYNEAAVLVGVRPRQEHSILVLAAGVAQTRGWVGPNGGCSFGCTGPLRSQFRGYGPAMAVEWASTLRWWGVGLSVMAVGGKGWYAGTATSVLFGRMP